MKGATRQDLVDGVSHVNSPDNASPKACEKQLQRAPGLKGEESGVEADGNHGLTAEVGCMAATDSCKSASQRTGGRTKLRYVSFQSPVTDAARK